MAKGELVPDEVVIEMIAGKIDSTKDRAGFLFDGFPHLVQTFFLRFMFTRCAIIRGKNAWSENHTDDK